MVTIINTSHKKKIWRSNWSQTVDLNRISVRWRDEKGQRLEKTVTQNPYVYVNPKKVNGLYTVKHGGVPEEHPVSEKDFMRKLRDLRKEDRRVVSFDYDGTVALDGTPLMRVDFHNVQERNRFRRNWAPLYNSRVKHEEQFCVKPNDPEFDSLFSTSMPNHILYYDLELLQYEDGDRPKYWKPNHEFHDTVVGPQNAAGMQEMVMIAVYADWLDTFIVWTQHPRFQEKDTDDLPREYKGRGEVRIFNDEKALLTDFVEWVSLHDPDILVAWNGDGYDLPMLWYRLIATDVGANRLSPYGIYDSPGQFDTGETDNYGESVWALRSGYRASAQPIRGRATIDLMRSFAKWWRSTKGQDLGGRVSLDRTTNDLLADYVTVGKAVDFKPDFFDKDYDGFIEEYIYYNIVDVDAMLQVENYANVIDLHLSIHNFLKVPFGSTFNSTRFCGVMFSKDAGFLPEDPIWDKQEEAKYEGWLKKDLTYEGAEVVDVTEEGNTGLHHNVAALDAAAMYPRNVIGMNLSWDTAVPHNSIEAAHSIDYEIKDKESKAVVGTQRIGFHTQYQGALPRIIQVVLDERARYKGEMKVAAANGDDLAYKQADNMQKAVKVVANSFYGVLGNPWEWGRDSLSHIAMFGLAGATTKYGKRQVGVVREYCKSKGLATVFGHTDSVFVKLGDSLSVEECVEIGHQLAEEVSEHVRETLSHDGAEWEFEQFMDRFFIAKKNRYAGRMAYDGHNIITHQPLHIRLKSSGFEFKRANTSKAVGDIQMETLELLFNGGTRDEIVTKLKGDFDRIKSGVVPLSDLVARKTIRQHLPARHFKVGWERYQLPHGSPVMANPEWTTGRTRAFKKKHEENICYQIKGKKNSQYRRWKVGQPVWRLLTEQRAAAAWFNEFIADDTEKVLEKGESFYYVNVTGGPTAIPYMVHKELGRNTGTIACRDLEQIESYQPDYYAYAYDAVVSPLKNIFEGMNWDLNLIRGKETPMLENYLV